MVKRDELNLEKKNCLIFIYQFLEQKQQQQQQQKKHYKTVFSYSEPKCGGLQDKRTRWRNTLVPDSVALVQDKMSFESYSYMILDWLI